MGYMKHHAIIAVSWDTLPRNGEVSNMGKAYQHIKKLIAEIDETFLVCLTPLQDSVVNAYQSFAFLPDGSKEDWNDSNKGDEIRAAICDYLDRNYGKSGYIEYIKIGFGGDDANLSIHQLDKSWYFEDRD